MRGLSLRRAVALSGLALLLAIAVATLIPAGWQIRTGLHWLVEHFLVYFAVTTLICLAWQRPLLVSAALMLLAGLLEALQGLTADRAPDLATAIFGAVGVLGGGSCAWWLQRLRQRRQLPQVRV